MAPQDTTPGHCEKGYHWYVCTWKRPYYSGCCRVDPCNQDPIGCPPSARDVPETSTTTIFNTLTTLIVETVMETETVPTIITVYPSYSSLSPTTTAPTTPTSTTRASTSHPTSHLASLTPSPEASAQISIPSSSPTSADDGGGGGNGINLSVGALVGISAACGILAIFSAIMAAMWWRRRQRENREKSEQANTLPSFRGPCDQREPPVQAQSGPTGSSGTAEGRMAEGGNIPGFTPLVRNGHSRPLSSDMRGGLPSPLTMGSSMGTGITSSPSELDSTPCYGEVAGDSGPRSEAAELESLPATQDEKIAEPRATLKSTQEERQSGTYANSWTRFHNLQL